MTTRQEARGDDNDLELIVALSEHAAMASQALQILKARTLDNRLAALNAAVLVQDLEDEILVFDITRADPRLGPIFGPTLGGVLWALSRPYSAATGHTEAIGPGGEEAAAWGDAELGLFLAALQSAFVPGGSALVVLTDKAAAKAVLGMLAGLQVQILKLALTDDSWTRLTGGVGSVGWRGDAG
jgi:uncharacterized membrane protein